MNKEITIVVDKDVYDKFCIALQLAGEEEDFVIENGMRSYITRTFDRISKKYNPSPVNEPAGDPNKDYYGKAIQRIPVWALKPNQYNHKIIRAFFEAEASTGQADLNTMELLCSNKDRSDLYVPTFKNNYAQMKIDGPKSHGKVFEDDGERVWIWKEVEEILRKNRDSFMR